MKFQPASTAEGAMISIANGLIYFFLKNWKITGLVLLTLFGSAFFVIFDYVKSERVKIEKLLPMKPTTELLNWNIQPQAIAGQQGDSLKVNGLFYGFYDPNYQIWRVQGEPAIFVHDKRNFSVYKVTVPSLQWIRK